MDCMGVSTELKWCGRSSEKIALFSTYPANKRLGGGRKGGGIVKKAVPKIYINTMIQSQNNKSAHE